MKTDTDDRVSMAELWSLANDMRESEENSFKTMEERLSEYKQLRGELEARLAKIEGRELPEDHPYNKDT